MSMVMILFLGMAGLTLDVGRAFFLYQELLSSTDAAALAGGYAMSQTNATKGTTGTVQAAVNAYSSYTGGANFNSSLPVVSAPAVYYDCNTSSLLSNVPCSGSPLNDNVIQVVQSASVPTYFIRALKIFGINSAQSISLVATATAAMKGAASQYNVAMVVDTTSSMGDNDTDASCGNTRIYCALQGVQTLLSYLTPCTAASIHSTCQGFDQVSLFTFPNVTASTAADDYTCPTTTKGTEAQPTIAPYYYPSSNISGTTTWTPPTGSSPTYQITGYLSDYSSNNQSGGPINASSFLAIATGGSGKSNCPGMQTPGGDGTYFAGAIYAALASLAQASANNPGSQNALIILSDGDACSYYTYKSGKTTTTNNCSKPSSGLTQMSTAGVNSNGLYPSYKDQCQQAVTAALSAENIPNTTVYAIAYGSSSSGCASDSPSISPCQTLRNMANQQGQQNLKYFYSDATATQNKGQCTSSANPNLTLDQIFVRVAGDMEHAELLPNSMFTGS
jgi:hypothetical protein